MQKSAKHFIALGIIGLLLIASGLDLLRPDGFFKSWFENANTAYEALKQQQQLANRLTEEIKHEDKAKFKIRTNLPGTTKGPILLTGLNVSKAHLINHAGKILHTWSYREKPLDHWRYFHAYPNGDIIALIENRTMTPYGRMLIKLDKDSNVIWRYDANPHHAFYVTQDERIVGLSQEFREVTLPSNKGLSKRLMLEDFLYILDKNGNETYRASLKNVFRNHQFKNFARHRKEQEWDMMHANSVMMLEGKMAKSFPQFKTGDVLISMREPSLIGVFDTNKKKFIWMAKEGWRRQHDAEFSPAGEIVLFDNKGGKEKRSRILAIAPQTGKTRILYNGNNDDGFRSQLLGGQQLLPGGHLLIIESSNRRIFEVNPKNNTLLWELRSNKYSSELRHAHLYPPGYFTFLKKN